MRCWQHQGFNAAAQKILDEKVIVGKYYLLSTYTDGRDPRSVVSEEDIFENTYTVEVYETRDIWYGELLTLRIYRFKDGRVLEDYIQADPWSSGPCTFLALRDHITKEPLVETLWDQETIDGV